MKYLKSKIKFLLPLLKLNEITNKIFQFEIILYYIQIGN